MAKRPKVTVIGGGTGSFAILSGLKHLDIDITALVNMVDDGGSTGLLRDEYGVLPPGDVRQCLVALSEAPETLRSLFNFRFPGDSALGGHSFGNLFLSAFEMMTNNFSESIEMASNILNIKGRVLPVTTEKCELVLQIGRKEVVGQQAIEKQTINRGSEYSLSLRPSANINSQSKKAIEEADLIIIAPGSLYSSIIPAILVDGMSESINSSKAKLLYICNLVNKPNHTLDFKVSDYIREISDYIASDRIDYVLYNVDMPSRRLLELYMDENEHPVEVDEENFLGYECKFIPGKFLSHSTQRQDKDDTLLSRSLIRHNSMAVASSVEQLLNDTF